MAVSLIDNVGPRLCFRDSASATRGPAPSTSGPASYVRGSAPPGVEGRFVSEAGEAAAVPSRAEVESREPGAGRRERGLQARDSREMLQSRSFKLQSPDRDRVYSSYEMSERLVAVRLLTGEKVKGEAMSVRKWTLYNQLRKSITGKLLCTNFRVVFIPVETGIPQAPSDGSLLLGADDVALSCIDRVVAVTSSRMKALTTTSSLKFQPQELLIYCKDFRLLHFQFEHESHACEVIPLIAQSCQPVCPWELFVFEYSMEMSNNLDPRRVDTNPDGVYPTRMFETHLDWEIELARTGALGWRVSLANERFEVSASLSKSLVVPRKILDLDVKKAGAYFNEGRIPRWHWHHRGSDLLRMGSFQSNACAQRDGLR
ncbi:myotubularin-related protein 10-A-like [Carcharodon carcharias]|uniref:myotubularin-related protein 10-A-like n=1 Tax=Carcharodon carcharias TaxID=13397 RepID=UPI001B7EB637|nr:myotubularin-related protein 10-A-like [Carcharodon carcharias]